MPQPESSKCIKELCVESGNSVTCIKFVLHVHAFEQVSIHVLVTQHEIRWYSVWVTCALCPCKT